MNFNVLKTNITRNIGRKVLVTKKQSPHIFFATGLAGVVVSNILACRATLQLDKVLSEIQTEINDVHVYLKSSAEDGSNEVYSTDQYRKDLVLVYSKAAVKITKLYGPSFIIGSVSVGLLTGSHIQMTRRNQALMAAYAIVQKAYNEYRDRVREELGPERELDIYRGTTKEIVRGADGKNKEIDLIDPNKLSPYSKLFDEYSERWEKDPELNRIFIECQQQYANNLLTARGHVFLNEVYDALGIERTKEGSVVGWLIDSDGDGYIDFGMYEAYNSEFLIGHERSIWLDFNVDGVIYDKI